MPLLFHSGQLIRFAVGCKIVLLHGSSGIFNSNFNNMRVASCMLRKNSRVDQKFSFWWKKDLQVVIVLFLMTSLTYLSLCPTYRLLYSLLICATPSNCHFFLPAHFFYTYSSIVSRVGALLHSTLKFIVETGCWQMAPLRFSLPTLIGFWGAKLQLDSICLPKKKLRGKCLFSAPQALLRESRVGFL